MVREPRDGGLGWGGAGGGGVQKQSSVSQGSSEDGAEGPLWKPGQAEGGPDWDERGS